MEFTEVLSEPFNYVFGILLFVFVILSGFIQVFKEYLTIIVTVLWVVFGMAAWSNDSYTTMWFAGTLTWFIWLWEAQKHTSESFGSRDTCPWVAGSDALFWAMSVPLFAIAIGLWGRTFILEDGDTWATFVGVMTMGYAAWLTLWRLSCVMPFMQQVRGGGFDYSPVDV